ncbi:hypothetical protein AVEN_48191-1 [Araneus ventricosus]|uniref:PiggyBac transposable element-derived protein domain-containing protein n=1 Tax=Araneus ventricosus TaxID=182803 RepID=A0A4Y2J9D8_ARAVE|nr:hypothetical protein AVEN_48191-1 [Araneus ventricosus]
MGKKHPNLLLKIKYIKICGVNSPHVLIHHITKFGLTSKKKRLSTSAALDMLFSLPGDPDDSDDDVCSELQSLENLDNPGTSSGSNVLTTEELSSADDDNSSESDHEMNEEWSNKVDFFDKIASSFNNEPNLKISFNSTEKDYFGMLFTEEILQNIVDETNSYVKQPKKRKRLCHITTDIVLNWKEITSEELEAWIGMHILMGIHQLPELKSLLEHRPYSQCSISRKEVQKNNRDFTCK